MRGAVWALSVVLFLALTRGANAGPCAPGDPLGRYEGAAKLPDGTALAVTFNLRCVDGAYAARFFTEQGDFDARDAAMAGGVLTIKFDNGVGLGVARLTPHGTDLAGEVAFGADKGPLVLTRVGPAWAPDDWRGRLDLTPAQWRADLAVLARELPRRHANAFAFLSKTQFEARVADLDRRLGAMNSDQAFVALTQLVNAIGDGHTSLVSPPDRQNMPIELAQIGGDFRIVAAGKGLERGLGAKVIRIGETPIGRAHALALTLTPTQELPELREGRVVYYLARGLTLHGLGITPGRDHAVYTLRGDDGRVFSLDVRGLGEAADAPMTSLRSKTALSAQDPDNPFWCRSLPDPRAVYCAWRGYQDLHAKAAAMWALVDQAKPEKLIIDMRDNGGGDNTVGEAQLVKPIKNRPDINRKGRLFVLVGPLTFSAAMNNAAQFQDQTQATLVGETIGEKPNSYQEPRQFRLPSSHLVVRVSTRYYAFRKTGENAVRPDKEIIPTWADVKAGRDPQLAWILAQP